MHENQLFLVKKYRLPKFSFLHISSSYAKILGGKLFRTQEFPEVGQKQKTEKKKKRERLNGCNNNGQLGIANFTSGGARKAAWANFHTGKTC